MAFNSIYFLWTFLPVAFLGYYLIDKKYQNYFLLFFSLFFYAWGSPHTVVILAISMCLNYVLTYALTKLHTGQKILLWVIVLLNIGLLFYYKYADFFLNHIFKLDKNLGDRTLPIGISFYTFSMLSCAIDIYKQQGEITGFADYGLYISFFPKLVQGPIVKYTDFIAQLKNRHVTLDGLYQGIVRFITGLGKKLLIANVLGEVADRIFGLTVHELSTSIAWLGALSYTLQIYYDFSGYSDMAIGLARLFGFNFKENFNYPYMSSSVKDFWRRWHISLSEWFKNYIYIPLGGNRKGEARTALNTLIVFTVTGIWHGANWTFWLWGLLHGFVQIAETFIWGKHLKKCKILSIIYTDFVVLLGWVLFRADTLNGAMIFMKNMFFYKAAEPNFTVPVFVDTKIFMVLLVGILCSGIVQKMFQKIKAADFLLKKGDLILESAKIIASLLVLLICLMSIANGAYKSFIYFKF